MIVVQTLEELCQARQVLLDDSLTFVPTMGALHEGHLALVKRAKALTKYTAVSIFVNPTQFDQIEDFQRYPKTQEADLKLLEQHKVDLVWVPRVEDIYPSGFATEVIVKGPALQWEGSIRPGHFEGVTTVVNRLLSLMRPQHACFGEKDWQQFQVLRRMVKDLALPVTLHGVPIVRESDGLAKSSRNRFLSEAERQRAPLLNKMLNQSKILLEQGEAIGKVQQKAINLLETNGFKVDYFAIVDAESLESLTQWQSNARLITAAHLGSVRLLDNL